jgi:glycosyltransferase involved in cell wall biosynthesis
LRGFGKIMSLPIAATYQEKFDHHKICVVIPTYNNEATVAGVIKDVLQYTRNIVVVNDGSTDSTPQLLEGLAHIQLVSYAQNVGKGWALRQAFKAARKLGYDYAITIDSDGQHFASDLPLFVDKLEAEGPAIIMGARNMQQESVPGKSSFGNKFSNFWFRVETGINCPDTQTGYRLYPIALLDKMRFFTRKYEFEIEVLVRSAWKGIKVNWIPIKVYYAPKEERISHFRPFKDFSRISVLNTVLVLITFLWIKPRNFFRKIFSSGNWWKNLNDQLSEPNETNARKAASVGFGVFMGIVPIWGFQLLVGIALAVLMRLNKVLFVIAANISIPPMIPLIIFLSYKAGAYWMGDKAVNLGFSEGISLQTIRLNLTQYIYGSITLAIVAGILFGLLTWGLLSLKKQKKDQ